MKRKPIQITAGLINAMNSYNKDHKYSINEVHELTGYHWNTVKDYVKLIILIEKFAPKLKIDEKSNEIIIAKQSPYLKNFSILEQLILYLFICKAFNEESAINKHKILLSDKSTLNINDEFKEFIKDTSNGALYLSLKGKFKAQGILASIYSDMGDFIEDKLKISLEKPSKVWLLNFYNKMRYSHKENKMKFKKIRSEQKEEIKENELDDYYFLTTSSSNAISSHKISTESIA